MDSDTGNTAKPGQCHCLFTAICGGISRVALYRGFEYMGSVVVTFL